MDFPLAEAKDLIRKALEEDVGQGDLSTSLTFQKNEPLQAKIVSKAEGVLCGVAFAKLVLEEFEEDVELKVLKKDGDLLEAGDEIFLLSGPAKTLLEAERTILNFIQQLSGVASITRKFVDQTLGTSCKILDTRKTLPAYRRLQKYAVFCGGGVNHRMGLYDMVMLKENHIHAAGGVKEALQKVYEGLPQGVKVEVEIENVAQLEEVLRFPVDQIMLDNMDTETTAALVQKIRSSGHKALLEASGNMTLERIASVAQTGVDFISVGALTHSVMAHDFSMRYV